jgi:multidrug resistance efflux pump
MEDREIYKDIELSSEEVQEVMNHIPPAIQRYGISALLGIISILLIGSAFFSYPDTVDTKFTLTTQVSPAYIIAQNPGRIQQLYVENKQPVREGDLIGVIQNTANTEDILYLREKLKEWKASGSLTEQIDMLLFHRIPELGLVQTAYSSCLLAWSNYLQHMQENRIYETEVINTVASLQVALTEWETNYLLMSPVNGTIAFMQLWKPNQNVEARETMFVVIPKDAVQPTGKALLPMEGIGKVEMGQRAIIRLPAFPEQEFGFIEGRVISISPVPDSEGCYVLEIAFPQGMKTNYGTEIPLIKSIEGTASIVTKERSLLERLINLKF